MQRYVKHLTKSKPSADGHFIKEVRGRNVGCGIWIPVKLSQYHFLIVCYNGWF